ncbi:hypothetical protein PIB30_032395 [Stylosanthes scabra]|uniref:Uncharacterized protein n=1 Tax=Stylosanthes scabra TaxID=79078 RepID=A0ABU6WAH3_9FABA|nr:hypothetical protein [Stylosanthes scabra]
MPVIGGHSGQQPRNMRFGEIHKSLWLILPTENAPAGACINFKALNIDEYVDDFYKRDAYLRCYESVIHPCNGPDLWERQAFDDILPLPYKKPSHWPTKKRRRSHPDKEGRNQICLSRFGQIQRYSNCGAARHKRSGCPKPPDGAQQSKKHKEASTSNSKGKGVAKLVTRRASRSLSQPAPETAAKKRKVTVGTSSSQPLPHSMRLSTTPSPTWQGRTRRTIAKPIPIALWLFDKWLFCVSHETRIGSLTSGSGECLTSVTLQRHHGICTC